MSSFFSRRNVCKLLASILAGTMCTGGVSFASEVSREEVGVRADLSSSSDADGASSKKASRSKRNAERKGKDGSKSRKSKKKSGAKSSGKSGVAGPKFVALSEFEALKNNVASLEAKGKWSTTRKALVIAVAVNRLVQLLTGSDTVEWIYSFVVPSYKPLVSRWLKEVGWCGCLQRIKAFIPIPFIREYELLNLILVTQKAQEVGGE